MASLLSENFENGTLGATITTANSQAYNVIGSPIFSDQAIEGSLAADFDADDSQVMIRWNHASAGLVWYSGYIWLGGLPSSNAYVAAFYSDTDKIGDMRINSDGTVSVRDNNLAVITSDIALTTGLWHRFSIQAEPNNQLQLRLYIGSNRHGSTPDYSGIGTSTRDFAIDNFRFGSVAAATIHLRLDRLRIDNSTEPGPMVDGTSPRTNWYLVTGTGTSRLLKSPVMVAGDTRLGYIGDSLTYQAGAGTTSNGGSGTAVADSLDDRYSSIRVDGQIGRPIIGSASGVSMQDVIDNWRLDGFDPTNWVIALGSNNLGASDGQWSNWVSQALDKVAEGGGSYTVYWVSIALRDDVADSRVTRFWSMLGDLTPPSNVNLVPLDFNTAIHAESQSGLWLGSDETGRHMTAGGYTIRNQVIRQLILDAG